MKKFILAAVIGFGINATAQDLPQPSPSSTIEQRVGLTDIKVEYSRPGMKGRVIFGDLVPYGVLWRTGANKVPNVTFSSDVKFGNKNVEAGTYALLTIPTADSWTIILNRNTEMWGVNGYDEDQNAVVVEVPAEEAGQTESFTIDINDIGNASANLVIRWEKTQVKIPINVEVHPIAIANIEKALAEASGDEAWQVYRNAAGYYYNNTDELDVAQTYIDKSLEMNENSWYSFWLKAEILAKRESFKDAIKAAKESIKVGEKSAKENDSEFGYKEMIEGAIEEWSAMK